MTKNDTEKIIKILYLFCNTVSVAGSLFIMIIFLLLKLNKYIGLKILFYVSVCDFFFSLGSLLVYETDVIIDFY